MTITMIKVQVSKCLVLAEEEHSRKNQDIALALDAVLAGAPAAKVEEEDVPEVDESAAAARAVSNLSNMSDLSGGQDEQLDEAIDLELDEEAGLEAGLIEAGILEASLFAEANHKRPGCDIVRPPLQENHHPPFFFLTRPA